MPRLASADAQLVIIHAIFQQINHSTEFNLTTTAKLAQRPAVVHWYISLSIHQLWTVYTHTANYNRQLSARCQLHYDINSVPIKIRIHCKTVVISAAPIAAVYYPKNRLRTRRLQLDRPITPMPQPASRTTAFAQQRSPVTNHYFWVTLNNASDYRTNGHYRTPNPNPNPNPSPLVH